MDIPLIEQIKIQARALVPLIRAMQAELGEERANALVRKAIGEQYRQLGEAWWRAQRGEAPADKLASSFEWFAAGGALDYDVVRSDADAFDVNVTGCRYAQFYQQLGAPEIGFLLVCDADAPMAEGSGAGIELTRTQTIMQGASHCDFRYQLRRARDPGT